MKNIIRFYPREEIVIKRCVCGKYPNFIHPNDHYSDTWLQCSCGRRTNNTGGFSYAREISLEEAKISAVTLWNNDYIFMENEK